MNLSSSSEVPALRRADAAAAQSNRHDWGSLTWLASQSVNSCPNLSMARVVIHRGRQNPRHSHPDSLEILHLLSGRLEHEVAGRWVTLEPGDTLKVDAAVPHHARSVGELDADMIVVYDSGARQFRDEPPAAA